jgi:hypothetical protein
VERPVGPPSDRVAGPLDPSKSQTAANRPGLLGGGRHLCSTWNTTRDFSPVHARSTWNARRGREVTESPFPLHPRKFQTQRSIDVACAADGRHSCSTWNTRHETPHTCPPRRSTWNLYRGRQMKSRASMACFTWNDHLQLLGQTRRSTWNLERARGRNVHSPAQH